MEMLGQDIRTPLVIERSGHAVPITGGGATTTVLSTVSSIHATLIDVFVKPTVAVKRVYLVLYAANGKISSTNQIHGALAAGAVMIIRWGQSAAQPVGQYYDVTVETENPAANGTVEVWTAARS